MELLIKNKMNFNRISILSQIVKKKRWNKNILKIACRSIDNEYIWDDYTIVLAWWAKLNSRAAFSSVHSMRNRKCNDGIFGELDERRNADHWNPVWFEPSCQTINPIRTDNSLFLLVLLIIVHFCVLSCEQFN